MESRRDISAQPLSKDTPFLGFTPPAMSAGRVAIGYLILAALWIALSDGLLFAVVTDHETAVKIEIAKGWLFVGASAVGLFFMLRAKFARQLALAAKLKSFVDQAPVALAVLDRDLRYVAARRRWRADLGLEGRELIGVKHYDIFTDLPEVWREVHARALRGETVSRDLEMLRCPNGSEIWLRREVRPWVDDTGRVGGIVIFAEDVTARKRSEDALSESRIRLRVALEAGRISTWSWDASSGRVEYDEAIHRLIGRTRDEIVAGGLDALRRWVHPDDRAALDGAISEALAAGTEASVEYRVVRPDGEVVWLANRGHVERDSNGAVVRMTGACVDLTEFKQMQAALCESEARFREVVETIREVFWISDVEKKRILYVSPGYSDIWGRRGEDLYVSSRAWLEAIHTDDRERILHAALTKQSDGTYDETYRVMRPDGSIRWVRDRAYPVKDAHGTLVRIVGCAQDITDRKELEEQFLRAQRLEAIGTLASGVAHDLNNILAPMFMIGPLLREKLSAQSDIDLVGIVESSAQRGANVVRQLLTFSRGIAGERGPLQLRHLVKEMTSIMNETFPREIGIVHQVPSDLWPVVGDATQLHQVLMNLCVNARDAMADGGRLSIDAKNLELCPDDLEGQPGVKPGRFVVITVSDSGHGMSNETKARIFEPFFTTKAPGKGTGLGLSTVLGIVKSHGGFVTVESQVGRGTKFHVHLPSAEARVDSHLPVKLAESAPGRGELVLIVDDETNVRQAMQRVLEHNGYTVLTAANGREGLGLYLLQREKVRVVVTDLMMPEMNGVALARALRDLNPKLPILAATGLISGEKRSELETLGVADLLPKPYTSFELLEAVTRALGSQPAADVPAPPPAPASE